MTLPAGNRVAACVGLCLMFALLIWQFSFFLTAGARAIQSPFELDYGEGIVWQQANMIFLPQAYGAIDGLSAIVFHYPPLYHVVTRAVSAFLGLDMLVAGRAVSIGSTLLTGVLVGVVSALATPASASRTEKLIAGCAGALIMFCFFPVIYWTRLMRVDMLANLLSVCGFWLGLKALQRPALIYAAAICFVGAVFTKQTSIAAPAAIFALTLWRKPRLAVSLASVCVVLGLVILGVLELLTGGGFLRHIVFYNINRIDLSQLQQIIITLRRQSLLFLIALLLAVRRSYDLRVRGAIALNEPGDLAWIGLLLYFATSTLMLATIAKSGASLNYFLEWCVVIAMLVGGGLTETLRFALAPPSNTSLVTRTASFIAPLSLAASAMGVLQSDIYAAAPANRLPELAALGERVRSAAKPIISDDMVILLKNGKAVVWEPAIFAELASKGVWDERPFIKRILDNDFSMFITEGVRGGVLFDSRYNPAIADAMDAAYPILEKQAGYIVHLPGPIATSQGRTEP